MGSTVELALVGGAGPEDISRRIGPESVRVDGLHDMKSTKNQ